MNGLRVAAHTVLWLLYVAIFFGGGRMDGNGRMEGKGWVVGLRVSGYAPWLIVLNIKEKVCAVRTFTKGTSAEV